MTPICIRWATLHDLPYLVHIDNYSYKEPWTENDFHTTLIQQNTICHVAEIGDQIVGYMVHEIKKAKSGRGNREIIRGAVHKDYRLQGIGRHMLQKKLLSRTPATTEIIKILVCEYDLGTQCFLRACGMRAGKTETQAFLRNDGSRDDGYWFTRKTESAAQLPAMQNQEMSL